MNTKELQYFLKVCENKSIHKAAQSLFISSQGLSRIIQRMEEEQGKPLLTRTQTGVEPTPYGKVFAKYARRIIEQMGSMNKEMERLSQDQAQLSVMCSYGVLSHFGTDMIFEFQKRYPGIRLDFKESSDKSTVEAVWHDEADVGLAFASADYERFHVIRLKDDELFLVVNRNNPLAEKKTVTFGDLKKEKFILANEQHHLHDVVLEHCREAGFQPNIILETSGICLCRTMVFQDHGVTIATKTMLDRIHPQKC